MRYLRLFVISFPLLAACSSNDPHPPPLKNNETKGEFIFRHHDEFRFVPEQPQKLAKEHYPWEIDEEMKLPKITKEYFRCKGSCNNPSRAVVNQKETIRIFDCGGVDTHSLPLRENKEFIYPILIDLLNFIQVKTEKRVVITSGHRCPEHNTYVDSSTANQYSKHMIGAEVSFYVQGYEEKPFAIIDLLQSYYKNHEKYKGQKEYLEFSRYEKKDTDVSTPPWYNKEIFVKIYNKSEGRNFDNRHPYPYISLQVRYDAALKERVTYSWDKAHKNYLRK